MRSDLPLARPTTTDSPAVSNFCTSKPWLASISSTRLEHSRTPSPVADTLGWAHRRAVSSM
ncbi:MAG TPA: hypothetical protein VF826_01910 [Chloroflexia bacterium]